MVDKEKVMEKLKQVIDPEIGMNIVEMRLIKDIKIDNNKVHITMTLTSPFCPLAGLIVEDVKEKIKNIEGVEEVKVDVVF